MSTKFRNLKNDLLDIEDQDQSLGPKSSYKSSTSSNSRVANYILLFAFFATLLVYIGSKISNSDISINPIETAVQNFNAPNQDLLNRMGAWMTEMGYGELSTEQLTELRAEGVTATYTNQIREVGYTDVSLEQLVALQGADVSATYARMMKELGYVFSVEDLIATRNAGVTANFTSQMMDLGYTIDELTMENLIRLRSIGVTAANAENLLSQNGTLATVDELIRFRISNQ